MSRLDQERKHFDRLFETVLRELPEKYRRVLDAVPVLIEDEPTDEIRAEMGEENLEEPSDLCGLYSGPSLAALAQGEGAGAAPLIHLYRGPLWRLSGDDDEALKEEIRITLLHELGHYFGFDDDELDDRGYG